MTCFAALLLGSCGSQTDISPIDRINEELVGPSQGLSITCIDKKRINDQSDETKDVTTKKTLPFYILTDLPELEVANADDPKSTLRLKDQPLKLTACLDNGTLKIKNSFILSSNAKLIKNYRQMTEKGLIYFNSPDLPIADKLLIGRYLTEDYGEINQIELHFGDTYFARSTGKGETLTNLLIAYYRSSDTIGSEQTNNSQSDVVNQSALPTTSFKPIDLTLNLKFNQYLKGEPTPAECTITGNISVTPFYESECK